MSIGALEDDGLVNTGLLARGLCPTRKPLNTLATWGMRERIWAGDIPVVRFPGVITMFGDMQRLESFIQRNRMTIM